MSTKTKESPHDLVPHPFPKKGSRKVVKRNYREYLIEQAKLAGSKEKPVPLTADVSPKTPPKKASKKVPDLGPDLDLVEAPRAEQPQGAIRESDNRPPIKPPKGVKELWLETGNPDDDKIRLKLSQLREKGAEGIQWRYYSMGFHVYWVPQKYL